MNNSSFLKHFKGHAYKYLAGVDVAPENRGAISNQHEIGGLPSAGAKAFLGDPGYADFHFNSHFFYLDNDGDCYSSLHDRVTWYDCRRDDLGRSPELRLYYTNSQASKQMKKGDFFFIAMKKNEDLIIVITPPGSSAEHMIRDLFHMHANLTQYDRLMKLLLS